MTGLQRWSHGWMTSTTSGGFMALEALRGYLTLASGVSDVTRAKAIAQAKALLADESVAPLLEGGVKAGAQVQGLAEEIIASGRANREVISHLIATEVDKAVALLTRSGSEQAKALRVSLDRLERRVAVLESTAAAASASARTGRAAAGRTTAASPKQAASKTTAPKKTAPKKTAPKKTATKKTATKKAAPATTVKQATS